MRVKLKDKVINNLSTTQNTIIALLVFVFIKYGYEAAPQIDFNISNENTIIKLSKEVADKYTVEWSSRTESK